jgi:flagellin-like hook-associated protein FlgL
MTTVPKSMFPLKTSYQLLSGMKARYDKLQVQLATGERHASLAEMGSGRYFNLSMRARLDKMESYSNTMNTVGLRLEVLDTTVSRLAKIQSTQRTSLTPGGYGTGNVNFATAPTVSRTAFDEVVDLLNAEVAGRYLMSGSHTDQKPVASARDIMDGQGGRAGFKQIVGERKLADRGADGLGRLAVAASGNAVTLAEDGVHPFGAKLSTLSSSSAAIGLGQPTGSPPALSVSFTTGALPVAGSTVTIGFTLPDGTSDSITLTATTDAPGPGQFQLGADADATAANFAAALETSLSKLVDTSVAAASTYAAADSFFNSQGTQVMRVDGPPFETATGMVAATESNTVLWYRGENSADPRSTVDAQVGDNSAVRYGVQANEDGITQLVRTLAAMSVETYPNTDPTSGARFDAMAGRQVARLSSENDNKANSIKVIAVELSLAELTMDNVQARQTTHKAKLEAMLADIVTIPPEEVSMEILSLKTRLEASYATTAMVSQLSLVNYLP